jgi:hypothetical protein
MGEDATRRQSKGEALTDPDMVLLEALSWWGVPTLFRCPYDPDPTGCDIAVAGVPHSSGNGSTERDQHLGPRAVRHVSAHNRRVHAAFGFSPWEACRIHDVGDVPLPEAMDNEACIERITAFFRRIADAGARAVAIGGDHSVTGAHQGLARQHHRHGRGTRGLRADRPDCGPAGGVAPRAVYASADPGSPQVCHRSTSTTTATLDQSRGSYGFPE